MAPELFDSSKPYNEKVDVYAFGCLLFEMLSRRVPWDGLGPAQIRAKVCNESARPEMPLSTPTPLVKLISACWAQSAAARPSFSDVANQLKEIGTA